MRLLGISWARARIRREELLLFRPSITSELLDLALAALWFVAVFLVVYGLMRVFRRKRRT